MGKTEKIHFTDEQLMEMVRLHNEEDLLNREIADIFGVSKMTINRRLAELGVKSRHPKLDLEREKWICDLYKEHKNKRAVEKIANVSPETISKLCQKYNMHEYDNSEVKRKYSINSHYFDEIDTPNKAYVLGLLFSDGTITSLKKHILRLSLQESDKKILEKILIDMESNHPLYFIDYNSKNPNHKNQYFFSINDYELCKGLYRQGMHANKSLSIEYPPYVPLEYNKDFIRGVLDGDGYISKCGHHTEIIGTEMLVSKIKEIVDKELNINCSICDCDKNHNSITKLFKVYGRRQAYTFLSWLYDDAELYIDRKYNMYISEYKNKVA